MKQILSLILLLLFAAAGNAANEKPAQTSSAVIGAFHINKDERIMLVQLKTNPEADDTLWQYQNQEYCGRSLIVTAPAAAEGKVLYRNGSNSGEIVFKTPAKHKNFYNLDQGIRIFAPFMLHRGAPGTLFSECFNRWPLDITLKWERKVSKELTSVKNLSLDLRLFTPSSEEKRFSPGDFYREKVIFDSCELPAAQEWNCTYTLSLPGKILLSRSVRFIPVAQLPELSVSYEGNLIDKAGSIVVPVIEDIKLEERRKWEFFRSIQRYIFCGRSAVLAPEMGQRMPSRFSEILCQKSKNIEFHPWPEAESSLLAVVEMLNIIRCTEVETMAIVIPPRSQRIGSDDRWVEYMHLLSAAAWSRPQMRKVVLIMLPSAPGGKESEDFMLGLRNLVRSSDTSLIELDGAEFCWDKESIFKPFAEAPGESSSLPHAAVQEISNIIIKNIR